MKQAELPKRKSLSAEQVDFFSKEGYLVVRQMFNAEEMLNITAWVDDVTSLPEVPGKYMFYFEDSQKDGSRILNRAENFCDYHKEMGQFARHPRIIQALSQLMCEDVVLFKDKINYKLPGGDGFKAHQDIQAAWDDYARFFISMSITIDEHTVENGCFEVCGGHHLRGMFGRRFEPLNDGDLKGIEFMHVPTKAGDAVFFDCYAPHQSERNMTDDKRRNIFLT